MTPGAMVMQMARQLAVGGRVRVADLERAAGAADLSAVLVALEKTGELRLDGEWVEGVVMGVRSSDEIVDRLRAAGYQVERADADAPAFRPVAIPGLGEALADVRHGKSAPRRKRSRRR